MIRRLLIANRGEIAVRITRTAAEFGIETVGIAPEDDRASLHLRVANRAAILTGSGPAAYLDSVQILAVAQAEGCDAIHPGYGFLSENAAFAAACAEAGLLFVGPTPTQLDMLGNKAEARALAERCGVPVLGGLSAPVSLDDISAFMRTHGAVMIKAVAGGGGRGIRLVTDESALADAYARCQSEALRAFGDDRLYAEEALIHARHIEVQILGDAHGAVIHLGERDCTLQRRHQKLIEVTPSPAIDDALRAKLVAAAIAMAREIGYRNAGTFEFLVESGREVPRFFFLEANPRLQVEHTVTEEVWDVDLVAAQLGIAAGASLEQLGLTGRAPRPGFALQARINMERLLADGTPVMDGGTIARFEPPTGPGVRVDTCGYRGLPTGLAYDSLLAKLIVGTRAPEFGTVLAKAERALADFRIDGVTTNLAFLRGLLAHPVVQADEVWTRFVDERLDELLATSVEMVVPSDSDADSLTEAQAASVDVPEGMIAAEAPLTGLIVSLAVAPGAHIRAGEQVAIVEAMKMEHVVVAPNGGTVAQVLVAPGATVASGHALALIVPDDNGSSVRADADAVDLDARRADLDELDMRQAQVLDAQRPDAVARRHNKGARTARENVADLCDPGTFVEYGALVVAGQRARRPLDELIRKTPGDGIVVGFGEVNGDLFPTPVAQSLVIAFDETVLAGTMGEMAREKLKHCLEVAHQSRRPVVLFAEGGGGRAGDTDLRVAVTGWTMDVSSYYQLGRMSGLTPLVGVTSGRCFAANAGMLACCDVIIATEDSNIGVGGPSMIEGGRLGSFAPEEIGPTRVQTRSGVIDVLVKDEAAAVAVAKTYLSYFQGPVSEWEAEDQRALRFVVPENRLRAYDVRKAIHLIADKESVLELRRHFGVGMVTALIRVAGKPLGVIANDPTHLGGAIDSDAADKASRFMRLCEAFGLPLLMLCDTPGVMVGPEAEKSGTVRKMGRMFVTGANLTVPFFTIVLRKAYGIGAELMAGGWFKAPRFVVSWPTGEFGGMNIEGNVKLAHAAELAAIADPAARQARFEALVAEMLSTGRALSVATHFEIDNVIDPAESRAWIEMAIASHPARALRADKTVPFVDPW